MSTTHKTIDAIDVFNKAKLARGKFLGELLGAAYKAVKRQTRV